MHRTHSHSHTSAIEKHTPFDRFVGRCVWTLTMCHFFSTNISSGFFLYSFSLCSTVKSAFVIDYNDNKYTWPSLIALGYINFPFDTFEPRAAICTQDVKNRSWMWWNWRCDNAQMINMPTHYCACALSGHKKEEKNRRKRKQDTIPTKTTQT